MTIDDRGTMKKQGSSDFTTLAPFPHSPILTSFRGHGGFTAIEAVIIVVVLAILGFSIGFKINTAGTKSVVASDQLIADIRYTQMKAVSIGRPYMITFSGNTYIISRTDNMEQETKKLPENEVASADICNPLIFNTLGEPILTGDCIISLSGGSKVKVFNITGKAEPTT